MSSVIQEAVPHSTIAETTSRSLGLRCFLTGLPLSVGYMPGDLLHEKGYYWRDLLARESRCEIWELIKSFVLRLFIKSASPYTSMALL